jgi:hypothetical protein
MKYIFSIIFIFLTFSIQAQVIPVGTIKKTNKLHTISITDIGAEPLNNWPRFQFKGTIQQNGSKASIVENGFVFKEGYYGTFPDLQNASRVVQVSNGTADFIATIGDFPQPISKFLGTIYSVRAYAKNSFGQVSYSEEIIAQVMYNFCEINPCKNGAGCINYISGPICTCTIAFCGDCCAQLADERACPGGNEQLCPYSIPIAKNTNLKFIKINENLSNKNIWYSSQTKATELPISKIVK